MTTRDLSTVHHPVTDLFPALDAASDISSWKLDAEQLQFFREHGYLSGVRVLDEAQVDAMCRELQGFFDPEHVGSELWYEYHSNESTDPDRVLFHALGAWRIGELFHDILWNPATNIAASQLLAVVGETQAPAVPVRFWHDQLFCKPARHGGVVAWHQDYSYWTRTAPLQHLTCWIGLDESTRDNGCLQYIPGSHRWDLLPITGLAGDMAAIRKVLDDEQWEALQNPVAIELEPGECAFHHPLMVHGSLENSTEQPRRACVINYVADGVRSQTDEPLLAGVPPIAAGKPLEGQFFPLLYSPV